MRHLVLLSRYNLLLSQTLLFDTFLLAPMQLLAGIFPSLSSLGTSDFVAGGFDIPLDLVAEHGMETLGYLLAFFIAGAFCLRAREVAS